MPRFAHQDVLQQGPKYIKDNCNKMALISDYTFGDSYAVVNGNIIAESAMADTDFTFSTVSNNERLTPATDKSDATPLGYTSGSGDLHLAFVDTVNSKVLYVTEVPEATISADFPLDFTNPQYYEAQQPTAPA